MQIRPLSKIEKKNLLRKAKASELVKGGVWYLKVQNGDFKTVVSDLDYLGMPIKRYSDFCNHCSKFGYIYLNREKPNFSLCEEMHKMDFERMEKYKKIIKITKNGRG